MVDGKRPPTVVWIIPLLIGFVGFYRVTQSPIFEIYRAVDIVQLLGSGVCFARHGGIVFMLRGRDRNVRKWHGPAKVARLRR